MMPAEWLPVVMQGSFDEIYVADGASLRLLHVNEAACANLQYPAAELAGMALTDIAQDILPHTLETLLPMSAAASAGPHQFETALYRQDGSSYPAEIRLFRCRTDATPVWIVIARDISERQQRNDEALPDKSRFGAIVSNTPGLVYQSVLQPNGMLSFNYLSDGCHALLGIAAEQLLSRPEQFFELVLPEDRSSYLESMDASAHDLHEWNWEGRIWIDEWKDIKWVNLRATPRQLPDGSVQWDGLMTNITQGKLEEIEIKRSRTHLAELSAHIEHVKEQERTRIAREVHDDIGGNLTAIKMALALLASRLPRNSKVLAEKAAYVDLLVDRTIESAHRIASDLRPSILDFGIVAAIEWQAEEFEKQIGIPCEFTTNAKEIELHSDQATAIFRIFQEALTNIAKHAGASQVTVQLARTRGNLNLKIIDDGKGMAAAERLKPQSFGIRGMIERANSLGGRLSIGQTDGGGCTISLRIPLPSNQAGA
ncbi:MAG: domain S-box protein [Burkholderiaceae bacterium]|nr:domain S-box protein [Burkholderiaceae bacterium]